MDPLLEVKRLEERHAKKIYFEEIFLFIGQFGVYQCLFYLLINIIAILHGAQVMATVFLGLQQQHWCHVERVAHLPYEQQRHLAIPLDNSTAKYHSCTMYNISWETSSLTSLSENQEAANATSVPCKKWEHDRSVMSSTIITKWDLVCGRSWLVGLTSTAYMAGMFVASIGSGVISDKFGRLRPFVVLSALHPLFALAAIFSPNVGLYIFCRFLMATCVFGGFITGFVLITEIIGPKYRVLANVVYHSFFSMGFSLLAACAYLVRDVTRLQMVLAFSGLITVTFYWILPESPRWLLSQGRSSEAMVIVRKIADVNKVCIPEGLAFRLPKNDSREMVKGKLSDLFRNRTLRFEILVSYLAWFAVCIVYYGLGLNTGALVGNVFVNGVLMGLVDVPWNFLTIWGVERIGRKATLAFCLLSAALVNILCIPLLLLDKLPGMLMALTLIGKGAAHGGFVAVYLFTAELFPTPLRQMAVGSSSMCSRVAGMLAPYLGRPLQSVWLPLPAVLFGAVGLLASVMTLQLPETRGRMLPDTIQEAENLAKMKRPTMTNT